MLREKEIFQRRIQEILTDWEQPGNTVSYKAHVYPWLIANDLEEGYCTHCSRELYVDTLIFLNVQDPAMAWCAPCVTKNLRRFRVLSLPADEVHQLGTHDLERLMKRIIIFFEGNAGCR